MRVLSLFDGMSCGQIALKEVGIIPEVYYASEINNHAIRQTQLNFPKTIQIGDVRDVDVSKLGRIDLIIGGSPCQNLSFIGKMKGVCTANETEIHTLQRYLALKNQGVEFEGESYLFWEFVRILKDAQTLNPGVKFLLENVNMQMKWEQMINRVIGAVGVHIDSSLLSAQNRHRIYWTNIHPTLPVPKNNNRTLKDILEASVDDTYYLCAEKSQKLLANYNKALDDKICEIGEMSYSLVYPYRNGEGGIKSPLFPYKSGCITATYYRGHDTFGTRPFIMEYPTISGGEANKHARLRRFTPTECARLQTIPSWYEWKCSNSQQYKMIGNGWTVNIIKYIFSFLKQNNMKNPNQQQTMDNNADNLVCSNIHKVLWVCESNTDNRQGYIGKVMKTYRNKTVLTDYADSTKLRVVDTSKTLEVSFAPIDEKNLLSDWINEQLLEDCTQHNNKYVGWYNEQPMYAEVLSDGRLYLKHILGTGIPDLMQDTLNEIMTPENIVFAINKTENTGGNDYWIVSFFTFV